MSKVIVDDDLRAKLNGLAGDTELCDSTGRALGYVISPDEYRRLLYARAKDQVSDEEIERLRQQSGGRKLVDILKDLGAA
jgi:hypothetical protein